MILVSDLHLTDVLADEYRWRIFDHLIKFIRKTKDKELYILGDLGDRKDRHSGELVNRMLEELWRLLGEDDITIDIIKGNHDDPLTGPPYWKILNYVSKRLIFYVRPTLLPNGVLLLPYTDNPHKDWKRALTWDMSAIFMHQPVNGAVLESGRKYEGAKPLPDLPDVPIWSGDIHTPQKIGRINYVGAPHPVKFGDDYKTRFVWLDNESFQLIEEIILPSMYRRILDVDSIEALNSKKVRSGDQVKVRFQIKPDSLHMWAVDKIKIEAWAKENAVIINSVEPVVMLGERSFDRALAVTNDPFSVLAQFATREGLTEEILNSGKRILKRVIEGE